MIIVDGLSTAFFPWPGCIVWFLSCQAGLCANSGVLARVGIDCGDCF